MYLSGGVADVSEGPSQDKRACKTSRIALSTLKDKRACKMLCFCCFNAEIRIRNCLQVLVSQRGKLKGIASGQCNYSTS